MSGSDPGPMPRRVAATASLGVLALTGAVMMSPLGGRAAMPGPLGSHHANLSERCSACHPASLDALQNPLHGQVATRVLSNFWPAQGHAKCVDLVLEGSGGQDIAEVGAHVVLVGIECRLRALHHVIGVAGERRVE